MRLGAEPTRSPAASQPPAPPPRPRRRGRCLTASSGRAMPAQGPARSARRRHRPPLPPKPVREVRNVVEAAGSTSVESAVLEDSQRGQPVSPPPKARIAVTGSQRAAATPPWGRADVPRPSRVSGRGVSIRSGAAAIAPVAPRHPRRHQPAPSVDQAGPGRPLTQRTVVAMIKVPAVATAERARPRRAATRSARREGHGEPMAGATQPSRGPSAASSRAPNVRWWAEEGRCHRLAYGCD